MPKIWKNTDYGNCDDAGICLWQANNESAFFEAVNEVGGPIDKVEVLRVQSKYNINVPVLRKNVVKSFLFELPLGNNYTKSLKLSLPVYQ